MKLTKNKIFKALLIIFIGAISSFFIFKIAAENNELVLIEYYDRMIVIFVVVIAAMAISSFITKRRK